MSEDIDVAVCLITYNCKEYIEDALNSILKQRTTFSWKLFIADDFSTDGTREVINYYQKIHKGRITLIYQERNVGPAKNWMDLIQFPNSKYISYLEGDDFWTDDEKLQKQFEFMEKHPECVFCFTNCEILTKEKKIVRRNDYSLPEIFDLHTLLKQNIIPPSPTTFYRKSIVPNRFPEIYFRSFNGDWIFVFLTAELGNFGFISDYTALYRENVGVISKNKSRFKLENGLKSNIELNKLTNFKYDYHIGNYEYHYEQITFACFEEKSRLNGINWFLKTVFYKLKNKGLYRLLTENNIFVKHSIKLLFGLK